jgi:putative flippase GtrA
VTSTIEQNSLVSRFANNTVVKFFLSAGIAFLVDVIVYYVFVNFIFGDDKVVFFGEKHSPNNLSLAISYSVGVVVNFFITKYAVFAESNLNSNKQFIRFSIVAAIGFFANYTLLRIFIEYLNFYPTLSRIASALSLGLVSFFVHKFFTFKIKST